MLRTFESLRGCTLHASDGEVGEVREFYFNDRHWRLRYLIVHTGSWLLGRSVLIIPDALGEVDAQSRAIEVHLTKQEVKDAPPFETDQPVSRQQEEQLHRHYDWDPYWVVPGAADLGAYAQEPYPEHDSIPEPRDPTPAEAGADPHLRSSAELANRYTIHARNGEVGRVYDFLLDDETWQVRYLVVRTGVWFGKDVLLAPDWIVGISFERGEVFVNLLRSAIQGAPEYDSRAPLSRSYEQRLHDHYRHRKYYWEALVPAGQT